MKKSISAKRAVALGMAVVLATGLLSGCGKKKNNGSEGLSEYVYVPHYTELPEEITDINYAYLFDDTVYFSSNVPVRSNGEIMTKAEIEKWQSEMETYYSQFKGVEALPAPVAEGEDSAVEETVAEGTVTDDPVVMPEPPGEYNDITYKTFLFAMNKDGSNYHRLEKYVPIEAGSDPYSYVNMERLVVDGQGNLWISETKTTTIFDLPDNFNPQTQNQWEYYKEEIVEAYIRKLSPEGEELANVDLSQYYVKPEGEENYRGRFYVNDMQADKAGNLYISDGQTIYVLDANATFLFKLTSEEWFSSFIGTKSGEMGIVQGAMKPDGTYGNLLKTIDVAAKGWGKEYDVPNSIWQTSAGGDKYDFCYTDSSSLFGYNLETGTAEKVLSWLNSDVNGDSVLFSTIQPDGNVFAISRDWGNGDGADNFEVIQLVRTLRSEVPQKHILTLATIWTDYNLKKQILKFNKTNPDYRIEVSDYSEFNNDGDYNAGTTKLNTEIVSGKIPDMISLNNLPYRQYAAKGLLEDLYPFLEADTGLGGRAALVPGILNAMETDGKLYQVATGFSAISIVGKPSVVGTEMGWTMSELRKIVEDHPEADVPFGMYMNRATLMQMFTMLSIDKYIDWQKGTCTFNSEDFKQLLSFVKTFPETENEAMYEDGGWIDPGVLIQEGRQLFDIFDVSDFQNYQYYKARFGGEITFKGMPAEDGNSGSVANLMGSLAMTSSCSDKEGAWQFMRILLDEEFQTKETWNLPINQKAFDKKLAEAMKQEYYTDENGNKVPQSKGGMSIGDGESIEFYALTQAEADQIMAVINSITRTFSYDESMLNIINEEAEFFFKGEKTVDQTADIIQSRMTIFINEQR